MPQINAKIVSRYKCFLIGVGRNGIYVVGVGVRIDPSWTDLNSEIFTLSVARNSQKSTRGCLFETGIVNGTIVQFDGGVSIGPL